MKNLKKLRNEYKLSQQQLADILHVTQQSVWKYENGLSHPDIDTLKALADLFHTSIDFLADYSNERSFGEAGREALSLSEKRLLHYFRAADEKDKEAVLRILESLSGKAARKKQAPS